jgi:CspA family cold shock protein
MKTGTVKWFNAAKGFGFVTLDDGSEDAFIHCNDVADYDRSPLLVGDRIGFNIKQSPKGPRAVNARPLR